ncbi:PREDICTED: vascular endothelial growth factor receptor 1-like [Branchiostoma belcheri]|uniref:Vascular endothelial growth factor receptor 1-like n=1 Tax=Branchiostoma belcheri TaxID=7741 RepID=A0A6P4YQD4_BRABE|nr:PREDICTED: vascular endothelial growth factor receptor 1-like [Branchiostoma belcheri]
MTSLTIFTLLAPGQIPERIKVAGLSATSFRVSWRTLPLVDHNGPDLRYLVSWRLQNETCWKLNLWKTATVGGSMSSYVVRNVTSGLLYEVTVQAANSKGQGPVSAPRHGQSLPALKRAPVLITPKREFNASISSTVELTCDAVGAVRSRRLWFNEARIVPTKLIQGTGSLLLDKVHFKDEGCYKCYAENDRGSTEGCRCLRVYGSRNITTTQTSITQPLSKIHSLFVCRMPPTSH